MGLTAQLIHDIEQNLTAIEAALVAHDPLLLPGLCQQLHQHLLASEQASGAAPLAAPLQRAVAQIDVRLKAVRQAMAQQSAFTDRSLSALLPERGLAGYGSGQAPFGASGKPGPQHRA